MKCPNDQTTLVISERQNIEIDYCPECRGVWLDRGELDKLIERGQSQATIPTVESQRYEQREVRPRSYDGDSHYKKKKKESFLGDIFDF
ncbi:MAG: zf-TFIIB domain-containing protein [Candidatus Saccharimonadales bacterium]